MTPKPPGVAHLVGGGPSTPRGLELAQGLPPLVVRLRAPILDALAQRIEGPIAVQPDVLFADRLLQEGEHLLAQNADLVTTRRELLAGMDHADSAAERMALMRHHVRVSVGEVKRQTRDLAALEGWMDVDTLVERIDRRRRHNAAALETLCRLLSRHPLRRAVVLLDRLLDSPWPVTRRVATETLADWVAHVVRTGKDRDDQSIDPPRRRLNALVRMASERGGDPLTVRRALRVIPALPRIQARRLLLERLQPPRQDEVVVQTDDFLVRAEAVRLAVALDEESARHAFTIARADPSETVQCALARALAGSGYLNAPGLLERLLSDSRVGRAVTASVRKAPGKALGPLSTLARELALLREGESRTVDANIDELAQALVPMARNDHGFALRKVWGDRVRVTRGRRRVTRLWRVLSELRRGDPGKRQYGDHLSGRTMDGTTLVPSARMADVSATEVVGQPVEAADGSWGPWLPLPDTLVDALWRGPLQLYTSVGRTSVRPPTGLQRLLAHLRIPFRIRRLDAARREALDARDAWGRGAFKRELEAMGFTLGGEVSEGPPRQMLGSWATIPAALVGVEWIDQLLGPVGARSLGVPELAVVLVLVATVFLTHLISSHLRVRRSRRRLPLVIGGWGTRGKSGVARLQAALFEGLGYDVVCKTTGCEAMMLRTAGDGRSEELYLFRPLDRATIWEHVDVMEHAARSGADVFVWECMGLRPRYVEQLQLGWTRDDVSTITNTYPDHEDVMGPTGEDVARVIARFMPREALAITAEQSMTPILRDRARELDTALVEVDERGVESLPEDLLGRFSYQEHPANVALVAEMAAQLGIDPEEAVVLMADHVVPDLGSLATFPRARTMGRIVEFTNGSSANERTGFMNNWERTGFARHGAERDGGTYHVAVVNNRHDRVARSQIFADIVVNDANAHRVLLIGSNLEGLQTYIRAALDHRLSRIDVFGGGPSGVEGRLDALAEWLRIPSAGHTIGRQARRLGISGRALDEALADLGRLGRTPPITAADREDALEGMRTRFAALVPEANSIFDPDRPTTRQALFHSAEELNEGVASLVHQWTEELREALEFGALRARCMEAVRVEAGLEAASDLQTLEADLVAFCGRLFLERRVIVVEDPKTTGDELIRALATSVPAGSLVRAMSVQNIKGTGLDLVYRWTYGRQVLRFAQDLSHADTSRRRSALESLSGWDEWCLPVAQEVLRLIQLAPEKQLFARRRVDAERHVRQAIATCRTEMGVRPTLGTQILGLPKRFLQAMMDPFASIWRRHRSDRILRALEDQRISNRKARLLFQELTLSQRGEEIADTSKDASLV